eukprot:187725_1
MYIMIYTSQNKINSYIDDDEYNTIIPMLLPSQEISLGKILQSIDESMHKSSHEDENMQILPGIQDVTTPTNGLRFYFDDQSSDDKKRKFYKALRRDLKPTQFPSTHQQIPFIEADESYDDIVNEFTDSASHSQHNASQPQSFAFKSNAPTQKQISFIEEYKFKRSEIQHPRYA